LKVVGVFVRAARPAKPPRIRYRLHTISLQRYCHPDKNPADVATERSTRTTESLRHPWGISRWKASLTRLMGHASQPLWWRGGRCSCPGGLRRRCFSIWLSHSYFPVPEVADAKQTIQWITVQPCGGLVFADPRCNDLVWAGLARLSTVRLLRTKDRTCPDARENGFWSSAANKRNVLDREYKVLKKPLMISRILILTIQDTCTHLGIFSTTKCTYLTVRHLSSPSDFLRHLIPLFSLSSTILVFHSYLLWLWQSSFVNFCRISSSS
jgi:hypothetical protein